MGGLAGHDSGQILATRAGGPAGGEAVSEAGTAGECPGGMAKVAREAGIKKRW